MQLCIFEDALAGNFHPLTYFRPVYDLRCGIMTLREKIIRAMPKAPLALHVRPFLANLVREENPGCTVNRVEAADCLFINGRLLMTRQAAAMIRRSTREALFMVGETIIGARLRGSRVQAVSESMSRGTPDLGGFPDLLRIEIQAPVLTYPWDILSHNAAEIEADAAALGGGISRGARIHKSAILATRQHIAIGSGCDIGPGAIIDAHDGPVRIGRKVRIYPGAVLEGPCAVGDGSIVRIHAKIYAGTSVGPVCKVGGEIERSVLHSHTNKQHDGFLGDSYLSMWVNLGAGTTNSNLKNTFGNVRVDINGTSIDTGRMFVGLFAGDHAKAGINSTINTGTVIGPSANLFGGGLPPKFIPAFSWGGASGLVPYELEKALAVAVTTMSRRNAAATETYKELFRHVYSITAHERRDLTA